ncbi:hypothetical protein PUN28_017284 [Cardiocondyla obscurior]|uniref:Uncharacterized protein n=1 Tax=Cardiocondyla obscurior TaxID=286306 RepID=A0AAW2ERH9_9HYME
MTCYALVCLWIKVTRHEIKSALCTCARAVVCACILYVAYVAEILTRVTENIFFPGCVTFTRLELRARRVLKLSWPRTTLGLSSRRSQFFTVLLLFYFILFFFFFFWLYTLIFFPAWYPH